MSKILAPIVLFVYNRPWHTKQTVEALQKNELAKESELFIYSDEAKNEDARKNVDEVREYVDKVEGFKKVTVTKREQNWGLAESIIDGVTKIINEYGKIIVLEDDLVTSPYFLKFMNKGLNIYEDRKNIFSITGFNFHSKFMKYDNLDNGYIYLNIRPMSWSWASWKDRWCGVDWDVRDFNKFIKNKTQKLEFNKGGTDLSNMLKNQMEGKVDSWYVRWSYFAYRNKLYTIYPKTSYINNIGHDNTGVHSGNDPRNIFAHRQLSDNGTFIMDYNIKLDQKIVDSFNRAFNLKYRSELKIFVKSLFNK